MTNSVFDSFSFLLQGTTLKWILLIPVGLILLDFLTGVASALRHGVFDPKALANFLSASGDGGKFITTMIATFSAYLFSGSNVTVTAAAMSTVLVMCFSLVTSISSNLGEIFNLSPVVVQDIEQAADTFLQLPQEQQVLQQPAQQQPVYIQQQAAPRTPSYVPAAPSMLPPAAPTPSFAPASFSQQPQPMQQQPQVRLEQPAQLAPFTPLTTNNSNAFLAPQQTFAPPVVAQPMPPQVQQQVAQQPFPSGL